MGLIDGALADEHPAFRDRAVASVEAVVAPRAEAIEQSGGFSRDVMAAAVEPWSLEPISSSPARHWPYA